MMPLEAEVRRDERVLCTIIIILRNFDAMIPQHTLQSLYIVNRLILIDIEHA